jgi:putative inorganic carbon (hco3(-)) transporter
MAERAVWRPPWRAWALLGIAALVLVHEVAPARLHGHWLVITPVLVAVAVVVLRSLWDLNPAINMCGAIVLSIFSGAWFQIGLGGLPLDRLLVILVVGQFLLRAPGVAHMPRLQIRNVHLLIGLTVIYVLASAIASGTLTTSSGFVSLIDMLGVAPYLMFLVAPAVFAGQRERNLLLVTLVALGAYLGVTAVFESVGPHSLVFPHYITRVDGELPDERAGGPFQSSVVEGFADYACAVAAAIAFTQWRALRRRWFAAFVGVVCVFGCFVTLERGVWIATVVGTVVAALATRAGRRWLVPAALACALVIAGALTLSSGLSHKTETRVSAQTSVWARQNQTSAGLRMVNAKPLFGFGWNRYKATSLEYFRQASEYPQDGYMLSEGAGSFEAPLPLHDTYLSFAVELGLVGALLWLASLLWGVGGAIFSRASPDLRPWKLGLLALGVFYLVVAFVDPHEQAFSLLVLWIWAGLALGGQPLSAQARRARRARSASRLAFGVGPARRPGLVFEAPRQ